MADSAADAVVVGGGIIGTSIAWRLAQAGLQTALLEAGNLGAEASWAGAGMLAPGGEITERTPWTDLALQSLGAYADFVAELSRESGVSIDFRQAGAVLVSWTEGEFREQLARHDAQAALGIHSAPLGPEEVRSRVPLLGGRPAGGFFFPQDAVVDPREVMHALRQCLWRRSVQVHEGCAVTAIRAQAGQVRVEGGALTVRAGAAVLAAGAWSSGVEVSVEGARRAIAESFPVRGHLLGYRLEPGTLVPILRHGHTYIVQRRNGFTIAGSSEERIGFDRTPSESMAADIHARAGALLPALATAGKPEVWLGFRPAAEGLIPQIGRVPDSRVWLAYGHYRNGILLAPATARRISAEITSSLETDLSPPAGSR